MIKKHVEQVLAADGGTPLTETTQAIMTGTVQSSATAGKDGEKSAQTYQTAPDSEPAEMESRFPGSKDNWE